MCLKVLYGAHIFDSPLLRDIRLGVGGGYLHNIAHPFLARSHPALSVLCKLYTEMGVPFVHVLFYYGKDSSVLNDLFSPHD